MIQKSDTNHSESINPHAFKESDVSTAEELDFRIAFGLFRIKNDRLAPLLPEEYKDYVSIEFNQTS